MVKVAAIVTATEWDPLRGECDFGGTAGRSLCGSAQNAVGKLTAESIEEVQLAAEFTGDARAKPNVDWY